MTIREIGEILNAETLCCSDRLDVEIKTACASDLMSDVLAFASDRGILLTGLVNPQVIRTAEMMDMKCVVFVRNKRPDESIVRLAAEKEIVIFQTKHRLFTASGLLFEKGLKESR